MTLFVHCMTAKRFSRSTEQPAPVLVIVESRRAWGGKIPTEQAMKRPAINAVQEIAK